MSRAMMFWSDMRRVLSLVGLLAAFTVLTAGCARQPPAVSHGGPVRDYVSLVDNLRASGATVEPAGEIIQDFFAVAGRAITVNGENVQVFEYPDDKSAGAAAAGVSPDGFEIRTEDRVAMVDWIAPPHFYQAGRLIVLYVGDKQGILDLLEDVLGAQFAGSE